LTVARHQRGGAVRGSIDLASPLARLDLKLTARIGKQHRLVVLGEVVRRRTIAGLERFRVPVRLLSLLSPTRALSVTLSVRATRQDGRSQLVHRLVLLKR
jgi:hypothetical protein